MDKVVAERPKWGVVFFRYDWFSATRTEIVREIKYDTFITVYKSDCDYYPRVRQKWRTLNHSSVCKDCGVQVPACCVCVCVFFLARCPSFRMLHLKLIVEQIRFGSQELHLQSQP